MKKLAKIILIVVAVLFVLGYLLAQLGKSVENENQPIYQKTGYEIKQDFMEGCTENGGNTEFCSCSYDGVVNKYGIDGFRKLAIEMEDTGVLPEEVLNEGINCYDLFEEEPEYEFNTDNIFDSERAEYYSVWGEGCPTSVSASEGLYCQCMFDTLYDEYGPEGLLELAHEQEKYGMTSEMMEAFNKCQHL